MKDRTGEINYNNFGSKMKIIKYRKANDIDILFVEYDCVLKHRKYSDFKNGKVKCPYEKRSWGHGCLGEGEYQIFENGKHTKCYKTWYNMLKRCYSKEFHKLQPTYEKCEVCKEWLNFQNFARWYYENYYQCANEKMQLDKDILVKGNKIYSPHTCVFVPSHINKIFEGNLSGIWFDEDRNKWRSYIHVYGKRKHLGRFLTKKEAFEQYKKAKENYIKEIANKYKDEIPYKLYNAMMTYEVNEND